MVNVLLVDDLVVTESTSITLLDQYVCLWKSQLMLYQASVPRYNPLSYTNLLNLILPIINQGEVIVWLTDLTKQIYPSLSAADKVSFADVIIGVYHPDVLQVSQGEDINDTKVLIKDIKGTPELYDQIVELASKKVFKPIKPKCLINP
jgi:hypothetical protein